VRDYVSHPYKTGKIIVLHTLMLLFLIANKKTKEMCILYSVKDGKNEEEGS
jgi:hypothetical protein